MTHQRIGVHSLNNKGNGATCIEYNNAFDITIKFDNSEIVNTLHWNDFIIGKFKSPFDKNADGGYLGNVFKTKEDLNRKIYCTWKDMLKRVNTINRTNRNKTYKDVDVCLDWYNYNNFKKWMQEQTNYLFWKNGYHWQIDKDILKKNNKIYSPENCCLVPHYINYLFIKKEGSRGDYPIGVHYDIQKGKLMAQCKNPLLNKTINLGRYDDVNEAFVTYKKYKESIIKEIAIRDYNNGYITKQCYEAMMKYEVEITD